MIIDPNPRVGGRPLKFKDVEELEKKINDYFLSLYDYARDMWGNRLKDKDYKAPADGSDDDNPYAGWVMKKVKVATITGLALHLDTTRDLLIDYGSGKYDYLDREGKPREPTEEEKHYESQVKLFSDTIRRAKQMIADDTEQQLYISGRSTGAIFSMRVNYGWQDKTVTEITNPDGSLNPYNALTAEELRKLAGK